MTPEERIEIYRKAKALYQSGYYPGLCAAFRKLGANVKDLPEIMTQKPKTTLDKAVKAEDWIWFSSRYTTPETTAARIKILEKAEFEVGQKIADQKMNDEIGRRMFFGILVIDDKGNAICQGDLCWTVTKSGRITQAFLTKVDEHLKYFLKEEDALEYAKSIGPLTQVKTGTPLLDYHGNIIYAGDWHWRVNYRGNVGKVVAPSYGTLFLHEEDAIRHSKIIKKGLEYAIDMINPEKDSAGLETIRKSRTPILTSEDGVDLFEGDKYWWLLDSAPLNIGCSMKIERSRVDKDTETMNNIKVFSTRKAAEDYRLNNARVLNYLEAYIFNPQQLKELVKSRLNEECKK